MVNSQTEISDAGIICFHSFTYAIKTMKKSIFVSILLLPAVLCLFYSCSPASSDNGLSADIKNIVDDATLKTITDLGMPINKGSNPTSLVNFYKASPLTLKATNVLNDYALGHVFSDYKFHFYAQDNAKLTIKFDYVAGAESGTGLGAFISGEGNNFSVFVQVHSSSGGKPAEVIHIISGTITSTGISNFYFANFMLNNYGDTSGTWMANGHGRIFYDGDGVTPVVANLQAKSFDGYPSAGLAAPIK